MSLKRTCGLARRSDRIRRCFVQITRWNRGTATFKKNIKNQKQTEIKTLAAQHLTGVVAPHAHNQHTSSQPKDSESGDTRVAFKIDLHEIFLYRPFQSSVQPLEGVVLKGVPAQVVPEYKDCV